MMGMEDWNVGMMEDWNVGILEWGNGGFALGNRIFHNSNIPAFPHSVVTTAEKGGYP
jgi:hypothetical protein